MFTGNGQNKTKENLIDFVERIEKLDAVGELVVQSISNDGMKNGYDTKTFDLLRSIYSGPMTILGGAKNLNNMASVILKHKCVGVAAGSIFVFKGIYDAVLINYPNKKERLELLHETTYTIL